METERISVAFAETKEKFVSFFDVRQVKAILENTFAERFERILSAVWIFDGHVSVKKQVNAKWQLINVAGHLKNAKTEVEPKIKNLEGIEIFNVKILFYPSLRNNLGFDDQDFPVFTSQMHLLTSELLNKVFYAL